MNPHTAETRFGRRVAQVRKLRGMTQAELGEAASFGISAIAKIETGKRRVSLQDAADLSSALDVHLSKMVGPSFVLETEIDPIQFKNPPKAVAGSFGGSGVR